MFDPSETQLPAHIRQILDEAAANKNPVPDHTKDGFDQPEKTYDQLMWQQQRVIDAKIYMTEVARVLFNREPKDLRMQAKNQSTRVNYLRDIYASDIQTIHPKHCNWYAEGQGIMDAAVMLQQQLPIRDTAKLQGLVNLLTNLPKSSRGWER